MKKYFIKRIEQPGIVKAGQYALLDKRFNNACIVKVIKTGKHFSTVSLDEQTWDTMTERLIPTKLIVCDRNIVEGDMIQMENSVEPIKYGEHESSRHLNLSLWFKIIGDVSPKAGYVKEDDEYNEEDLRMEIVRSGGFGSSEMVSIGTKISPTSKKVFGKFVYIKGPCGHFH